MGLGAGIRVLLLQNAVATLNAPPSSRSRSAFHALILTLALPAAAAAQDTTTQFWPEIDTFVRLNEKMRIYVPLSRTRVGTENSGQDGTTGIYLDYYTSPIGRLYLLGPSNAARMGRLMLRAGYGYTAGGDGKPATNALTVEATGRVFLPWELNLSDRNRFDLNFSGGDFDPRYRNRLRLERNVCLVRTTLTPYVYGEFFYDFDQGEWFRTRGTAGLEVHLWERFVPEVYFQRDFNNGSTGDVNGFGLVFSLYLR